MTTLRQFYKAAALQGLLAGSLSTEELYGFGKDSDIRTVRLLIAECCGQLADEMLKEDALHERGTDAEAQARVQLDQSDL